MFSKFPFGSMPVKASIIALVAATTAISGCTSTASSSSNPTTSATSVTGSAKPEKTDSTANPNRSRAHVTRTGEVYLMRGLLNVFSRGMDVIGARMRSRGFDAVSYNHADWKPYADDIIARNKRGEVSFPIIIMGHSLGGNESPKMANYLAANGIKTSLIVTFDPTEAQIVGPKIDTVINYYLPNGRNVIQKGAGFSGSLSNVDVSSIPEIKHTNIEKNTGLQNKSIEKVIALTRSIGGSKSKTSSKKRRKLRAS